MGLWDAHKPISLFTEESIAMKQVVWNDQAISDLCRGLALQLHAGVGLGDGLFLLAEESHGAEKELLLSMGRKLDEGVSLHEAMAQTGAFPAYATGLLAVGDRAGRTEQALSALADFYLRRTKLRRQLRSAVAYPALLVALMLVVICVLLMRVLPVFEDVYASLGAGLTGLAGGLLRLGAALNAALPVLLGILAVLVIAAVVLICAKGLRAQLTSAFRARWGDKGVMRAYNNAHFAQALAMALRSGLNLEEGVQLGAELLEGSPAQARAEQCRAMLEQGIALNEALTKAQLLLPKESRLLALGTRGGSADRVMEELAAEKADEAERSLEAILSKVEPTMVLCASVLVGVILLAVMLPLLDIMSAIG